MSPCLDGDDDDYDRNYMTAEEILRWYDECEYSDIEPGRMFENNYNEAVELEKQRSNE